jgi:carboxylesterase
MPPRYPAGMTAELIDPLAAGFRLEGTNGDAVVLVHGFTGIPAHCRPLAAALNDSGYTVIAPRLAGHGTSVEDLATTGADDWIASAREAVEEVADHRRIHLAGLSMGGLISILLAQPVAATTVTTINAPVIVRNKKLYLTPVAHHFRPRVEWPESDDPDLDPEVEPYWMPYRGFPTRAASELYSIMRRAAIAAWHLDRPSLVIQSKIDEAVDPRSADILRRLLGRRCRLMWLENSRHNALLDRERDAVARAVLERIGDPT